MKGYVTTSLQRDPECDFDKKERHIDLVCCKNGVPSSLVFSITALDDLMFTGEDFLLQNLCAPAFVYSCYLQYLRSIDIGICSSPHDGYTANHTFVYLDVDAFERARNGRGIGTCLDGGIDGIIDFDGCLLTLYPLCCLHRAIGRGLRWRSSCER